ncbi:MAG: hypothetical protein V4537_05160 [Pseudomonadota bacterium]
MTFADLDYYRRRAEAQLELAQKTELAAAVSAHVVIAERYLELCEPIRESEVAMQGGVPRLKPMAYVD